MSDKADSPKPQRQNRRNVKNESRKDRAQEGRETHKYNRQQSRRDGVKSRYDKMEDSEDHEEILKQVEFYFGDSNLPVDNYLLKLTGGHKNRPVPLEIIHSFKRMQRFKSYDVVREALLKSTFLNLDEEDGITRKVPLSEQWTEDNIPSNNKLFNEEKVPRTTYVKGFGKEDADTQLAIENIFKRYGPVNSIRLRRTATKAFKGSVFVEWADEKTQTEFLARDDKPQWKGQDLQIMSNQDYIDMKMRQMAIDPDDWNARRRQDQRKDNHRHKNSRGNRRDRGNGRRRDERDSKPEDKEVAEDTKAAGTGEDVAPHNAKADGGSEHMSVEHKDNPKVPAAEAVRQDDNDADTAPKKRARDGDDEGDEAEDETTKRARKDDSDLKGDTDKLVES